MEKNAGIYVAGHRGMVGSAIVRQLEKHGYTNILTRTSAQLDLRNQLAVNDFFAQTKPDYVFLSAAKVGGIHANNVYRAEFLFDNLMIEANIIDAAYRTGCKKLLFLGSSCIYPKMAEQPLKEESLLSGFLEPTNEPYAIAKIAGIKLCEAYRDQYGCNFISAMPTNQAWKYGVPAHHFASFCTWMIWPKHACISCCITTKNFLSMWARVKTCPLRPLPRWFERLSDSKAPFTGIRKSLMALRAN